MTRIEKLAMYKYEIRYRANQMIVQSDPLTAYGDGLDDISRALDLGGRYDIDESNIDGAIRWSRPETDEELRIRNRIMYYLSSNET